MVEGIVFPASVMEKMEPREPNSLLESHSLMEGARTIHTPGTIALPLRDGFPTFLHCALLLQLLLPILQMGSLPDLALLMLHDSASIFQAVSEENLSSSLRHPGEWSPQCLGLVLLQNAVLSQQTVRRAWAL